MKAMVAVALLSAGLTAACAAYVRGRRSPAAGPFSIVLALETVYSLAYARELSTDSLQAKVFWDALQLVPATLMPLFLLDLTNRWVVPARSLPRSVWSALAVPLLLQLAVVFSEPLHGTARADAHLDPVHGNLVYSFTTAESVAMLVLYAIVVWSLTTLVFDSFRRPRAFVGHALPVLIAVGLPTCGSLPLLAFDLRMFGERDIAPLWMGLSAVYLTFAGFRRSAFDLVPVARSLVVERLPDLVLVRDDDGRLVDANLAARETLELTDALLARPLPARAALPQPLTALLDALAADRTELALGAREFELDRRRLASKGGVGAELLRLTDITARRRQEAELEERVRERTLELQRANEALQVEMRERRAAEQLVTTIFDNAVDLMGCVALDGTLLAANRLSLSMIGADADSVVGRPFWETPWWTHLPEQAEWLRHSLRRCAETGERLSTRVTHPRGDGPELAEVEFTVAPVRDEHGKVTLLIVEGRDLTEQLRADAEREKLVRQLEASQRLESLGRLAGGVAHDFNNMLTVILAHAESVKEQLGDARAVATAVGEIQEAAEASARLTQQLLSFARRQVVSPKVLDLVALVHQTERLLTSVSGPDVKLTLALPSDPTYSRVDAVQVEQILVNLAGNARDAMPGGGTLAVELTTVDVPEPGALGALHTPAPLGWVRLRVSDTGSGMDAATAARVFEPFFTTKPLGKGTGLGLSTVLGAVEKLGGAIALETRLGEGTRFSVYLPRATPEGSVP